MPSTGKWTGENMTTHLYLHPFTSAENAVLHSLFLQSTVITQMIDSLRVAQSFLPNTINYYQQWSKYDKGMAKIQGSNFYLDTVYWHFS